MWETAGTVTEKGGKSTSPPKPISPSVSNHLEGNVIIIRLRLAHGLEWRPSDLVFKNVPLRFFLSVFPISVFLNIGGIGISHYNMLLSRERG